ncbi:DUF4861 domain-containing protein [Hymenobacter sp. H14-R3]|uniref:DUF4861 domain-containing protein n=1 Tax=Hymenobacter sp. H14-R3 TaxID=3046308 RepID=UPI0024BAAC33|nr:DUF4861 domain-containing protein [Hymenobacter sp. H14-R3]MDJ0367496.1 DUF4861 domain-containing protein [Hymenobacter sp. H14-R3]
MSLSEFLFGLWGGLALAGGRPAAPPRTLAFVVQNQLGQARPAETVSLPRRRWQALAAAVGAENLVVREAGTNAALVTQLLDSDGDGRPDELLFQTALPASGQRQFTLSGAGPRPAPEHTTFARFVPERTDDYAWENDRVAFRTYGPNAQELFDKKDRNGTLSSGMDCWLKRVSYPIIDKWYGAAVAQSGFYHHDRGEGYDPYHVGASRGCGGTGVWADGQLYVSRNFLSYRTLATGPIRAVFELTYAPWPAAGHLITEKKRISLDLGSNLTRYEDYLSSPAALPNCTIGLTLHQQKGQVRADSAAGWFRYWEPVDDAALGTGVVVAPAAVRRFLDYRTAQKDQSQLLILARPQPSPVVYYAGFGWTKSGQFASAQDWDDYLAAFAQRLASPPVVRWL